MELWRERLGEKVSIPWRYSSDFGQQANGEDIYGRERYTYSETLEMAMFIVKRNEKADRA